MLVLQSRELNPLPVPARNDSVNRLVGNAEDGAKRPKGFPGRIKRANDGYIASLKLRLWKFFRGRSSALLSHITHVVFMGAKKQMTGIYASPIVASVTDQKSVWYLPERNLPSYTMGALVLSEKPKIPIAVEPRGLPLPALARSADMNFIPESGMLGKIYHVGNLLCRLSATLPVFAHAGALSRPLIIPPRRLVNVQ